VKCWLNAPEAQPIRLKCAAWNPTHRSTQPSVRFHRSWGDIDPLLDVQERSSDSLDSCHAVDAPKGFNHVNGVRRQSTVSVLMSWAGQQTLMDFRNENSDIFPKMQKPRTMVFGLYLVAPKDSPRYGFRLYLCI
jgi:hypothetical protein